MLHRTPRGLQDAAPELQVLQVVGLVADLLPKILANLTSKSRLELLPLLQLLAHRQAAMARR
jgi:hypothetical protein